MIGYGISRGCMHVRVRASVLCVSYAEDFPCAQTFIVPPVCVLTDDILIYKLVCLRIVCFLCRVVRPFARACKFVFTRAVDLKPIMKGQLGRANAHTYV